MDNLLMDSLLKMDFAIDEEKINQLNKYYEMLVEKNKVMNLTAITEYDEVVIKHFVDSLAISKVYDMIPIKNIIDIGTGAGFPGMVLKIFYPDIQFTLLESDF